MFERIATWSTRWAGSTPAFILAAASIVLWMLTGPMFHWSDTWQLVAEACGAADWEELLADCPVDAVILSSDDEADLDQAVRQLAQAGIAVLLPPELTQPADITRRAGVFRRAPTGLH